MSRNSPEGAIAYILWRAYEMGLPDTPYRMGQLIAKQLRAEGYLPEEDKEIIVTGGAQ